MNAPTRISEAEAALARFRAQWPPERCQRLGRLIDGDPAEVAKVWAKALAPKPTDTPADAAVRGLLSDAELSDLSRQQRKFNRERGV